jgi:hypothetical protein
LHNALCNVLHPVNHDVILPTNNEEIEIKWVKKRVKVGKEDEQVIRLVEP